MSKHNDEFLIHLQIEDVRDACKDAAAELGWRIMEESDNYISCKEVVPQITSFTWPAKVDVHLHPDQTQTQVILEGSIFGLGPIQSGHLRGQMGKFRNLIERSAKQATRQTKDNHTFSISAEIERLAELHSKGLLSKDEFKIAKDKLLSK
jgi:hypothetical protein